MSKSVTTSSNDSSAERSLSIDSMERSAKRLSLMVVRSQVLMRFIDEKERSQDAEVTAMVKMIWKRLKRFGKAALSGDSSWKTS